MLEVIEVEIFAIAMGIAGGKSTMSATEVGSVEYIVGATLIVASVALLLLIMKSTSAKSS